MAAKAASAITVAPENGAEAKNRTSMSGSRRCSSVTTRPAGRDQGGQEAADDER